MREPDDPQPRSAHESHPPQRHAPLIELRNLFGRRLLSRAARVVARALAGVMVLAALLWLVAAQGIGMRVVIPWALGMAAPDGWSVRADAVTGDWRRGFEIDGLVAWSGETVIEIRDAGVSYRVPPLLERTIDVREITVRGLEVRSARLAERDTRGAADTPSWPDSAALDGLRRSLRSITHGPALGRWTLLVDRVEVTGGAVDVGSSREGLRRARGIRMLGSLRAGPSGVRAELSRLRARIPTTVPADVETPSGNGKASSGRVAFAASFDRGVLRVDTLGIDTGRSRVAGRGHLSLLPDPDAEEVATFHIEATPLDLRDLPVRLPAGMEREPRVRLSATSGAAPDSAWADATVTGPDASRVDVRLRTWPGQTPVRGDDARPRPVAARLEADFAGIPSRLLPGRMLDSSQLEGHLEVEAGALDATVPARLAATVTRRPVPNRPSPTAVGTVDLAGVPIRMEVEGSGQLSGLFDSSIEATDEVELRATLSAALPRPPVVAAPAVAPNRAVWEQLAGVEARGTLRRASWSLDAALDSTRVSGEGEAGIEGKRPVVVVDRIDVERFDTRMVDPTLPATSITGRISGRLRGGDDPATLDGQVALDLGRSTIGATVVDSVTVRATVRDRLVEGTMTARDPRSRARLAYELVVADTALVGSLTEARITSIDSAAVDGAGALEVRGRASGRWALGEGERRGRVTARVDSGRVGSVRIDEADMDARIEGGLLTARVDGRMSARSGHPIDVRAETELTVTTPSEMEGVVELRARRAAGDPAHRDEVEATIRSTAPGRFVGHSALRPREGGSIVADGSASVGEDAWALDLAGSGALPEPVAALDGAKLDTLVLEASASGRRGALADGRLRLTLGRAEWKGLSLDSARLELSADSAHIRLDTLALESDVLTAAGGGSISTSPSPDSITLAATLGDVTTVRELLEQQVLSVGRGSGQLVVAGRPDSIRIRSELQVRAIAVDRVRLQDLDLSGAVVLDDPFSGKLEPTAGEAHLSLARLALPDVDIGRVDVRVTGRPDSIGVRVAADVDAARRGRLGMSIDPRPDRKSIVVEAVDLRLDADEWALASPARVSYLDGWVVDSFVLVSNGQEVRFEGGIDGAGTLDLDVAVDSTDIGTVTDLVGMPRLRGWVAGRARLHGPSRAPEGALALRGLLGAGAGSREPVDVEADSDGRVVTTSISLGSPDGGFASVDGAIPLVASASDSTSLELSARGFPVSWLGSFLDPSTVEPVGGRLSGDLRITGSREAPELDGALALRDGTVEIPALGVVWERVSMDVRGEEGALLLDSAIVHSGSGHARAHGSVTVSDSLRLDLRLGLDGFEGIDDDAYAATVSGSLSLDGTVLAPVVRGDVEVESVDVYLDRRAGDDDVEDVQLTEADLRILRDRFGYVARGDEARRRPLSERVTGELTVRLGRDSWIRKNGSPELSVAFTGTVDASLRPESPPRVTGTLETIEGRGFIQQFGRRFVVRQGTVTLDGPPSEAELDLSATYTVPSRGNPDDAEATIVLGVRGTRDDLSLDLSSEPPMENADIVSYIATGRPATGALTSPDGSQDGGLLASGAGIALNQLVGAIEGAAGRGVGLDVVEIRREGLRGATLAAGKYVSPRLYVGVAQPVTLRGEATGSPERSSESQVEIELQALRGLLVNVESSGSDVRIFLRGRVAY